MKKLIKKIRAMINRTFVADCPRCHTHFFGFHEYGKQIKFENTNFRIICHRCFDEHKKKVDKVG